MAANESRDIRCKSSAWIICTFSSDGEYDENDDKDDLMSDDNDTIREAFRKEKSQNCGLFPYGGGAQPHSIAFGGVFPNITEAILMMKFAHK